MPEGLTLSQIGEQELIRRLAAFARADQWNDDAALLPEISPERWVISSDTLVEGVHFSQDHTGISRRVARCCGQPLRFGGDGMPPL